MLNNSLHYYSVYVYTRLLHLMTPFFWLLGIIIILLGLLMCVITQTYSSFKLLDKGTGKKKSLYRTEKGTYIKKWDRENSDKYFLEKKFYLTLEKSDHFPNLVRHDDSQFELEMEDAGTPLLGHSKKQWQELERQIPDWKFQFKEIISLLNENNLEYGDWHKGNILYKDGVLKLIDSSDNPGEPPPPPSDRHPSMLSYIDYLKRRNLKRKEMKKREKKRKKEEEKRKTRT